MSIATTETTIKRPPNLIISEETGASYALGSPLGDGSHGHVYKALSKQNSPLAAKTNHRVNAFEAQLLQKEGEILALLKNAPHTLKMRESFSVTDKSYFILTERLIIPHVRDMFIKGNYGATPLLCKQLFSIARQLGEALHYCHRTAGIVHRDLKPENLFYNAEKDELTIIDFGWAAKISALKGMFYKELVVAKAYRSPEAVLLRPYADTLDLWSAGCILFELYTGSFLFPFEGEEFEDSKTQILSSQTIINHFQAFADRLGIPSEEWIASLKGTPPLFEQNPNTKQYFIRFRSTNKVRLRHWKAAILAAAEKKKESNEEAQRLCDLIEPMLDYDFKKRIDAEGLLKRIAALTGEKSTNNQTASTADSKVETVT